MKYILIEFTKGLNCQAYQVINPYMECIGFVDLQGNPLEVPEITESRVINPELIDQPF